jgi:hypothetical protein
MFAGTGFAEADLGEDWFFVSFFYTFLQMRQDGNSSSMVIALVQLHVGRLLLLSVGEFNLENGIDRTQAAGKGSYTIGGFSDEKNCFLSCLYSLRACFSCRVGNRLE